MFTLTDVVSCTGMDRVLGVAAISFPDLHLEAW